MSLRSLGPGQGLVPSTEGAPTQIVLAFDTGYLMAEPIGGLPRLDHAIHAGLLLGWVAIVACGTASYACHVAKYWFERLAGLPCDVDVASEFRYREPPLSPRSWAIFVSQSGETADTLAALRAEIDRRGLRDRQRHGERRVGAKARLVRRAVQRDHRLVDGDLILRVHAADRVEDLPANRLDGFAHALAAEARLVAVAQLHGLVGAGRGARRHRGAATGVVLEDHVDLDGRIAAAVEDFAGVDVDDGGHGRAPERVRLCLSRRVRAGEAWWR